MNPLSQLLQSQSARAAVKRACPEIAYSTLTRLSQGKFDPRFSTYHRIMAVLQPSEWSEHDFKVGGAVQHPLRGKGIITQMGDTSIPYEYRTARVNFESPARWGWILLTQLEPA